MSEIVITSQGNVHNVSIGGVVTHRDLSDKGLRMLSDLTDNKELARLCRVTLKLEKPREAKTPEPKADKKKADKLEDGDADDDKSGKKADDKKPSEDKKKADK